MLVHTTFEFVVYIMKQLRQDTVDVLVSSLNISIFLECMQHIVVYVYEVENMQSTTLYIYI